MLNLNEDEQQAFNDYCADVRGFEAMLSPFDGEWVYVELGNLYCPVKDYNPYDDINELQEVALELVARHGDKYDQSNLYVMREFVYKHMNESGFDLQTPYENICNDSDRFDDDSFDNGNYDGITFGGLDFPTDWDKDALPPGVRKVIDVIANEIEEMVEETKSDPDYFNNECARIKMHCEMDGYCLDLSTFHPYQNIKQLVNIVQLVNNNSDISFADFLTKKDDGNLKMEATMREYVMRAGNEANFLQRETIKSIQRTEQFNKLCFDIIE